MDALDKFLHSTAYKFSKGYPDMNNEQDILLLKKLLKENMDIDLEEQTQTKLDFPEEENFKEKFIELISNAPGEELENDPIYKSLFKRLKNYRNKLLDNFKQELENRNIGSLYKAIYNIAEDFGEADNLYEYLISKNQVKSLNSIGKLDDLYVNASKYISKGLFDVLAKKGEISVGGVMMGKGELALILMMEDAKRLKEKGDVQIGDKKYELKANGARFSSGGIGTGREGNISQVYDELNKKYDIESTESLNNYLYKILTTTPESLSDINSLLNKIYPKSENIKLTSSDINSPDSIRKILIKKYITGYTSDRPDAEYMFITDGNDYQIFNSEQLLESIDKFKFTGITKSSAYPQIVL
jgi:hypothetical protein